MKKKPLHQIVLTDDDDFILETISSVLSANGFEVTTFNNGPDTIDFFKKNKKHELLLIDYEMTPLTGIETVRQILNHRDLSFIFLTSHIEESLVKEAGALGALTYITKDTPLSAMIPQIQVAIYRARHIYSLSQEKTTNRHINIALGIMAERYKITPDEAFHALRKKARDKGKKLVDLAEEVLAAKEKARINDRKMYGF